jgi:putative transposase
MQLMALQTIYPKPNLSKPHPGHKIYPYLLRDVEIVRPNQVWSADITYIRLKGGFMYLFAIIDWYSRYVIGWGLSNSLENSFCMDVLKKCLQEHPSPSIWNTDQGVQFTAIAFISILEQLNIQISMDGRGRALDNVFVERLWRSVKQEYVYINEIESGSELYRGLKNYFEFYCKVRPHQSLEYQTPYEVHYGIAKEIFFDARK